MSGLFNAFSSENLEYKGYLAYAKTRAKALAGVQKLVPMPRPMLFTGEKACSELLDMMFAQGCRRVLIVTDNILYDLEVLAPIIKHLTNLQMSYDVYMDVKPDPTFSVVEAGINKGREHQADAVLAVGGGSVIDASKMIAMCLGNNCSAKKLMGFFKARKPCLPFYAVPTTAGTGSEATIGAVVSDDDTHQKGISIDPKMVPRGTAIDPTIMQGMPPHVTADTGIDVLTHALEAWMSVNATKETDYYAATAVKLVMHNLPLAYENGSDLAARESMGLAAHYAGIALNKAGLGYVHAIAHQLGAYYGVPHGRANAIVLPHILDMNRVVSQKRLASLVKQTGLSKKPSQSDEQLANDFIEAVKQLIEDIGIDPKIPDMQPEHFTDMAKAAAKEVSDTYAVPLYMNNQSIIDIIKKIDANSSL